MAREQLPQTSLRDLRKEFTREDPESGTSGFDELAYMNELRIRLEAIQTVGQETLLALAEERRAAIIEQLASGGTLQPGQLEPGPAKAFAPDQDNWVRIELGLDVGPEPGAQKTGT
jgi:hypothetical protein